MKMLKVVLSAAMMASVGSYAIAGEHLKSVNPAYIDSTIPAGEDFYRHVIDLL